MSDGASRSQAAGCELCRHPGGSEIWRDADWRVVRVADDAYPAFYRVIANRHVAEFSDLPAAARQRCIELVAAVEGALRRQLAPTKINLASLGNQVAHLHWHVIARYGDDSHFPGAVWAAAQRERNAALEAELAAQLPAAEARMVAALERLLTA